MNTFATEHPRFGSDYHNADMLVSRVSPAARFKCSTEVLAVRSPGSPAFGLPLPGIAESVAEIVAGQSAGLSPNLRQRIAELSQLPPNWDGEGGMAIKPHVLADVVETLKMLGQRALNFREPFLAPIFTGFVQMEWHDKKRSLEIEAVRDGWCLVGTLLGVDGKRQYFASECERSNFQNLSKFYQWFVGAELLWPSP